MNKQDNIGFVCVFQPANSIHAGMIREALEQAGINCYVNNDIASSVRLGGVSIGAGATRVMVPDDSAAKAREIITGLGIK